MFRFAGRATVSAFKGRTHQLASLHSLLGPTKSFTSSYPACPFIRAVPSSLPLGPCRTLHQQQATPTCDEPQPPRPYSEIPKTKTVLGLNLEVMRRPHNLEKYLIEQIQKLGYIFRITGIPGIPEMLCVMSPQDTEAAYRVGDIEYPERFPFTEWKQARKELNRPQGMFLEDGENWQKQRLPISKFIMMPRKMAEYHEPFNRVTGDYINLLRSQRNTENLFMNIVESLNRWSLESVSLFVLGKRMGCLEEQMPPDCVEFVYNTHVNLETTNKLLFGGLPFHKLWKTRTWKRMVNAQGMMLSYAGKLVAERIDAIETSSAALEAGDAHAELGEDFLTYMIHSGKMSVQELSVNAIDLLLAGVDTTSLTMAGCCYSLARNPEVQERLREEVQRVVGDETLVTPKHIQDMHYLRDTIKETMRLSPIVLNNSRVMKEDVVISGYKVPAGSLILMSTFATGHLPEFFPEPEKFKPERWSRDNVKLPNSFASLPFGFGRRMCVGRRVAELEMHILLAQMVRNFRIEYRDVKPMEFQTKLFYGPARQLDLALIDLK